MNDNKGFLNEVLKAAYDVQLFEPVEEVGERDNLVVDEIPSQLKALYSLSIQWDRASEETVIAARYEQDKRAKEELTNKARALAKKGELVREIFWVDLKDTYNLWGKPVVVILKGWKAVWREQEPPPQRIVDALASLGFKLA